MYQIDRFELFRENEPRVGVVIGTGPSLSKEQIEKVSHLRKFGCNNTFQFDLDVHLSCNWQWWDTYYEDIKEYSCAKWTTRPESASKYSINYIEERWEPGLSRSKDYICAHHGSGPQILNLSYLYGCKLIVLLGWDMKYDPAYNGVAKKVGNSPRHFFGEYPSQLQHWPSVKVDNGVLTGLIEEIETIHPTDYGIDIVNCTPDSALTHFPTHSLDEVLQWNLSKYI